MSWISPDLEQLPFLCTTPIEMRTQTGFIMKLHVFQGMIVVTVKSEDCLGLF